MACMVMDHIIKANREEAEDRDVKHSSLLHR